MMGNSAFFDVSDRSLYPNPSLVRRPLGLGVEKSGCPGGGSVSCERTQTVRRGLRGSGRELERQEGLPSIEATLISWARVSAGLD